MDGILLSGGNNSGIGLAKVTDGAAHTLIVGERGICNDVFGWPYCGWGEDGTGLGDNLESTAVPMTPGKPDWTGGAHPTPIPTIPTSGAIIRKWPNSLWRTVPGTS